ncbi:helix-turn-helix domain-containing protein [Marinimicrobium sp. ABcell2]|uniref:helix-turn-helix domain-containing protein n=1 Tax=Marinimicrobium sp. ABcell2 TaxID=3069751 RepID=UPI0027B7A6F3|nr:helix-turn-helix transcriptional regulator [Marinimicrobium sp. ABcell2]MDQ2076618.1 helix-turn-helix transcriptional regulator [Marinimicrobium sp. ABcell2]
MSLGNALKELRKSQGLTLAELAARTDSHVGNLSRIERDAAKPSLDLLYRLADALSFSLADIFSVAEQSEADGEQVALNALFISLLEQDRELLLEFARLLQKRASRSPEDVYVQEQSVPAETEESEESEEDEHGEVMETEGSGEASND